jgi:hypothetical protein
VKQNERNWREKREFFVKKMADEAKRIRKAVPTGPRDRTDREMEFL